MGFSWYVPRVVTGWLQHSACIVCPSAGALAIPFGYSPTVNMPQGYHGHGQRFIVSFDNGTSFSNRVFHLQTGGEYASSVATSDDTIVTVFAASEGTSVGKLQVIYWRLPPQSEIAGNGFFSPATITDLSAEMMPEVAAVLKTDDGGDSI